jgi:hypothetical protein
METPGGYDQYRETFRAHYENNFSDSPFHYTSCESAYLRGYRLATKPEYEGMEWEELEPEVRAEWEESQDVPWEQYKKACRYAWKETQASDS